MSRKIILNEHLNEYSFAYLFSNVRKPTKESIKKVNMIPKDANVCRIYSDGSFVYANSVFYTGDIVEVCPVQEISKSALYDSDVRRIVFEVVKNEQYVIPFGYCQFYALSDEYNEPNCEYIWDPNTKVIVIKALTKISKTDKLVLKA